MPDGNTTHRGRWGVLGVVAAAITCLGCCAIPFVAGITVFGVALCSTKFLGASLLAAVAIGAIAGTLTYRVKRRRRAQGGPVPVSFGTRR